MNGLIEAIFSQSTRTHFDLDNRRELLEKNLNRIFASQGAVEFWEHTEEPNAVHQLTYPSADAFKTHHMVLSHLRHFGNVELTPLNERRPETSKV